MTFKFKKGGKLIFNKWIPPTQWNNERRSYDDDGYYQEVDMTDTLDWLHKRDRITLIEEGVTLNDFFLFASKHSSILDIVLTNCFVAQYMEVWEKIDQSTIKFEHEYDPSELEWLELYWNPELIDMWDHDKNESSGLTEIAGLNHAGFHGIGFELKEDINEDGPYVIYKAGTRINWGIDFCELKDLLGLPVKLDTEFEVTPKYQDAPENTPYSEWPRLISVHRQYTLENILHAIFWELSFYGSETEKLEKKEELDNAVDEWKSSNASND